MGYDIRSLTRRRALGLLIEVKGHIPGAEDVTVTRNEVLCCKNVDRYRLALVSARG